MDTSDASEYTSSEDERQAMKDKARREDQRMLAASKKVAAEENEVEMQSLTNTASTMGDSGMTFNEEVE